MKKMAGRVVGAVSLLGMFACGGGAPDFKALEQSFSTPTGTFQGQETEAMDAASVQLANGTSLGGLAGGFGLGSGSFPLLSKATSVPGQCPELTDPNGSGKGTCNCPTSGSVTFDLSKFKPYMSDSGTPPTGPIDAELSIQANACKIGGSSGGQTMEITADGSIYAKVKATSLKPVSDDLYALVAAHFSVTGMPNNENGSTGTKDLKVDADVMYKDKVAYVAVKISSGTIAVGMETGSSGFNTETKTGTLHILDKTGKTTCTVTNGKGTCTGPDGTTRNVG